MKKRQGKKREEELKKRQREEVERPEVEPKEKKKNPPEELKNEEEVKQQQVEKIKKEEKEVETRMNRSSRKIHPGSTCEVEISGLLVMAVCCFSTLQISSKQPTTTKEFK